MYRPIVVITGASSGIGAATARALAPQCRLVLVARRQDRLQALCEELATDDHTPSYIVCDVCDRPQRDALMAQARSCYDGIDVFINNAGIFLAMPHVRLQQASLDALWEVNVTAPMMLTRQALACLRASTCGHIINISSAAVETPFANCGAYAASKAAIEAWSASLREELRSYGVRVSVVVPGATQTEIWPPDSDFPADKMSTAEDVAAVIAAILAMPVRTSLDRVVMNPAGGAL